MSPVNVVMLLRESTGLQVQQTSAVSGNQSFRIQGLDGKYTQLLKDGFPLYSGYAGGLSIMQIPPLDLKQVEVIKGSASTLYGGGAIAGLINLVSKQPGFKPENMLMFNATTARGYDMNGFSSARKNKLGYTCYASQNFQRAYDPNGDGFSDIPQFVLTTINPRLFYYLDSITTIMLGLNTAFEERTGGDLQVINGESDSLHRYFEENSTKRISSQVKIDRILDSASSFTFKNSVSWFDRSISNPLNNFAGEQWSTFTELSYSQAYRKSFWINGLNIWTDKFSAGKETGQSFLDFEQKVIGAFSQNTYNFTDKIILESGLRFDISSVQTDSSAKSWSQLLPRASLLYKFNKKFSGRLGAGAGYKNPGIFSDETERVAFRNVAPINFNLVKPEQSKGANLDFNFRAGDVAKEFAIAINQLFFITRVNSPVVLNPDSAAMNRLVFMNADGYLNTMGFETQVKLSYKSFKLFMGYTFLDARNHYNNVKTPISLIARNTFLATLMYEKEHDLRIGLESFVSDRKYLSNGTYSKSYFTLGAMAEKWFGSFSLFINFENFTDTRQSKWQAMYSGSRQNPQFTDVYAPVEGFVLNGGIKIIIE
jgi:outer membrane receptor for ferrienterochelin and colicins